MKYVLRQRTIFRTNVQRSSKKGKRQNKECCQKLFIDTMIYQQEFDRYAYIVRCCYDRHLNSNIMYGLFDTSINRLI